MAQREFICKFRVAIIIPRVIELGCVCFFFKATTVFPCTRFTGSPDCFHISDRNVIGGFSVSIFVRPAVPLGKLPEERVSVGHVACFFQDVSVLINGCYFIAVL